MMTEDKFQDLLTYVPSLSVDARKLLHAERLITDRLRLSASEPRGDSAHLLEAPADISERRRAVIEVIDALKKQVAQVIELRSKSERKAETLLMIGGLIVLCLPVALTVSNLLGLSTNWISALFNGLSTAGFAALMFGPGREIRKAAKDRTALLLLPLGYEVRAAAATTSEDLQKVAADLESTLRGFAVTTADN
jgi:hypothetical protein